MLLLLFLLHPLLLPLLLLQQHEVAVRRLVPCPVFAPSFLWHVASPELNLRPSPSITCPSRGSRSSSCSLCLPVAIGSKAPRSSPPRGDTPSAPNPLYVSGRF